MSDLPSQAESQSAVESLMIQLARNLAESSRANFGLTEDVYGLRDELANKSKQLGANGVVKGADDALEDGSPFDESTDVITAVP